MQTTSLVMICQFDCRAKVNCLDARSRYVATENFLASIGADTDSGDHHKVEAMQARPLTGSCNDGASVDAEGEDSRPGPPGEFDLALELVRSLRQATVFDGSGQRGHGSRVPSFAQSVSGRRCASNNLGRRLWTANTI